MRISFPQCEKSLSVHCSTVKMLHSIIFIRADIIMFSSWVKNQSWKMFLFACEALLQVKKITNEKDSTLKVETVK